MSPIDALFSPLAGVLVLIWRSVSRTPWAAIGYARPKSWVGEALLGLVAGGVLKLVMKALVMPLFVDDPVNRTYQILQGNPSVLPAMLFVIFFGAGFSEETLFRGFLFERGRKWFGTSRGATVAIVVVTSVLFALAHVGHQGAPGAIQALFTGLAFGAAYARIGRLWPVMWAHVGFDLVALWIIYAGLEEAVGRSVFR